MGDTVSTVADAVEELTKLLTQEGLPCMDPSLFSPFVFI